MNYKGYSKITIRAGYEKKPCKNPQEQNSTSFQFEKVIPILGDDHKYRIRGSEGNGNNYVCIPFGDIPRRDLFELDSSWLLIPKSISEFQNLYHQVLRSCDIQQHIISKIGEFLIIDKQKLKLKDISGRQGYPTLINISRKCENQELIKSNVFVIGRTSKLKVQQNNQLFGEFLDSPQLFDITKKAIVLGLDSGMDELFKQSFKGKIAQRPFYQTLNSIKLKKEFDEYYSKSCIYIKIDQDQSYLLVENSKRNPSFEKNSAQLYSRRGQSLPVQLSRNALSINKSRGSLCFFTIGRNLLSDIVLKSQQVSDYHGTIVYLQKIKKWIIVDGQCNNFRSTQWNTSENGTWLEMAQNKDYYLDNEQIIKVNDIEITMHWD
ncbi:unnamed protein product [Paramecium octaurelia]|uniref:FHA domain-containing protein n=1 Tax=Paramecium octaurelia TaxID=43137 RepID=A0A8S1XPF3_PAROT|nr:unnamed protein product [Paramecium octaurelia]